ncbi:hypothetical protein F2Q70_00042581 [Brassica cretica]|uniref:Uncharacterized protein n=1 Tax=Brassica cretica TaxID=69181 RepID=A0A8S9KIA6_BRACR|nr:hypothetical protein F2Q70_00042581 [Brassica cretica]
MCASSMLMKLQVKKVVVSRHCFKLRRLWSQGIGDHHWLSSSKLGHILSFSGCQKKGGYKEPATLRLPSSFECEARNALVPACHLKLDKKKSHGSLEKQPDLSLSNHEECTLLMSLSLKQTVPSSLMSLSPHLTKPVGEVSVPVKELLDQNKDGGEEEKMVTYAVRRSNPIPIPRDDQRRRRRDHPRRRDQSRHFGIEID